MVAIYVTLLLVSSMQLMVGTNSSDLKVIFANMSDSMKNELVTEAADILSESELNTMKEKINSGDFDAVVNLVRGLPGEKAAKFSQIISKLNGGENEEAEGKKEEKEEEKEHTEEKGANTDEESGSFYVGSGAAVLSLSLFLAWNV